MGLLRHMRQRENLLARFPPHGLFTDFRDRQLRFPVTVVAPNGAGVNFLAGCRGGHQQHWPSVNEYHGNDHHLNIDNRIYGIDREGEIGPQIDLDDLYQRCLLMPTPGVHDSAAHAHDLPVMTALTHDYHTDLLLVIEVDDELAWFVRLLYWAKTWFNNSYDAPKSMLLILEDMELGSQAMAPFEYEAMAHDLTRKLQCMRLIMTPVSWRWYLHAKSAGLPLSDVNLFCDFVSETVFSEIPRVLAGDRPSITLRKQSKFYRDSVAFMRDHARVQVMEYSRVFMDLELPDTEALPGLTQQALRAYTEANIALVHSLVPLLGSGLQSPVSQRLLSITQRLC